MTTKAPTPRRPPATPWKGERRLPSTPAWPPTPTPQPKGGKA